ncbi:hypothetical protein LO762_25665 [Actinocorallia sp. API 0066]|uniref:hypothetical protein n=1 Tax=Actinocorallia sp. API 0066 TaxID=2896846 RepID=UPI001E3F1128|nr:hypothetical protein [Actinocorallia sp. API 0066]MCD0452547.1 hypothetical protein [Actinocorallia sp. API 0066]
MGRRRELRTAVLGPAPRRLLTSAEPPLRAVEGRIVDASPHLLVLRAPARAGGGEPVAYEFRMPMSGRTTVWHGGKADLSALVPGRDAVVRPTPDGLAAERVWVDILRVNGVIVSVARERASGAHNIEVDQGPHRPRAHVTIPKENFGFILVRHPRLEPGQLFDVIALRSERGPVAIKPGTAQAGPLAEVPSPASSTLLRGTATWFSGDGRGAAYPALDPYGDSGGCPDAPASCASLPLLSLGSSLRVRNDCGRRSAEVDVIECGCTAARFCDRCVVCGTSPRGRVVELTRASFVDLGGDLDVGCFNVTLVVG